MPLPRRPLVACVAALALTALAGSAGATGPTEPTGPTGPAPVGAARSSASARLPRVTSGARPGPDALYAPAPRAPQLEQTGVWRADPVLVSGATAYRDGEWLYQDFLYDDHGAAGAVDPGTPYGPSSDLYSTTGGTYTYPTDRAFADNGADLVELRVKPLADATAFRITLNTLRAPDRTAATLALGAGPSTAWPHGAGVSSPAQLFLTWHGGTAELRRAATGAVVPGATAHVDLLRRQVELRVPHAAWDPGRSVVRTTVGVGLWDPAAGAYLKPTAGPATATAPGGGTPSGVAIVNVGPRLHEPMPMVRGATMADTAAGGAVQAPWWRERQQSLQLALGDVTPFAGSVDFGKLARRVTDDSGVPRTGALDRVFASSRSYGQGLDPSQVCFDLARSFAAGAACKGRLVGQLQPYALYVPTTPVPARGYGMTLLLHSLSANYNQYLGSRNQSQLGDRGAGSLVLTPGGRGPDGFYAGTAELDTFEAWADVLRHYRVDAGWTAVSGYSMGGFGTFRMLARWPDLFARGFSVVGAPGSVADQLASLRNTPLLSWNATQDELVNLTTTRNTIAGLTAAGVRFDEDLFLTADHLTLAANDQFAPGAAFLGSSRVDRSPAHVSYAVDPRQDSAGVVADHAYWLSGLTAAGGRTGTIDVRSQGFGAADAPVLPVASGGGALAGGELPALAYAEQARAWGAVPRAGRRDRLDVVAHGVRSVTVDVARARVTCAATVTGTSDVPLTMVLAGCGRSVHLG